MERIIASTVDYCRDRKAFGQSILDNQVVHFRLAELETEVELLRSTLYRTVGKRRMVDLNFQFSVVIPFLTIYGFVIHKIEFWH